MRYELNQKLFAVNFAYPGNITLGLYSPPLLRNDLMPTKINFVELEVTEHHRVPNSWGAADDKSCDGYLLKTSDGVEFANQYPSASYGQISDAADRRFHKHIESIEQLEKGEPYEYNLLSDTLSLIYKGIDDLEKHGTVLALTLRKQLIDLRSDIEKEFALQFPATAIVAKHESLIEGSDLKHWVISFYTNPV